MATAKKRFNVKDFNIKESELSQLKPNELNLRIEYMQKEIARLSDELTKQKRKKDIKKLSDELIVVEPI